MKFFTSSYILNPISNLSAMDTGLMREGALIKIQWPDGLIGYADLHPWIELGDPELGQHIGGLKKSHITPLMEQTIWLARRDAKLRKKAESGFASLSKVKNHALVIDLKDANDKYLSELKTQGFKTIKVKLGRDIPEEAKWVTRVLKQNNFLLRLDFNAKLDYAQFEEFIKLVDTSIRPRIEFVEDPIPYDLLAWKELSAYVNLAVDNEYAKVDFERTPKLPFKVGILKPARQDVTQAVERFAKHNLKIVVTSSMDHPVGIAHAGLVAQEIKRDHPTLLLDCGILSHRIYSMNHYSNMLKVQGPYFIGVDGVGIGFNNLLEKENWKALELL